MPKTITISEARRTLTRIPLRFQKQLDTLEITQRGQPVMALLPWELYESLIETLEILADQELTAALSTSARQIKRGKTFSTREVERRLGL